MTSWLICAPTRTLCSSEHPWCRRCVIDSLSRTFLWRGAPEFFCAVQPATINVLRMLVRPRRQQLVAVTRACFGTRVSCPCRLLVVPFFLAFCVVPFCVALHYSTPYGRHCIPSQGFSDSNRCAVHDPPRRACHRSRVVAYARQIPDRSRAFTRNTWEALTRRAYQMHITGALAEIDLDWRKKAAFGAGVGRFLLCEGSFVSGRLALPAHTRSAASLENDSVEMGWLTCLCFGKDSLHTLAPCPRFVRATMYDNARGLTEHLSIYPFELGGK